MQYDEFPPKNTTPTVIDVTLRDGGFINNWQFSRPFILRHLAVCKQIGINVCEVGYVNNLVERSDSCFLKCLLPMDIKWMEKVSNMVFCIMCDDGKYSPDLLPSAEEMGVGLLRVVAKYPFREQLQYDLKSIKLKGYRISLNIAACSFLRNGDVMNLDDFLHQNREYIHMVYFADSFGSMLPVEVCNIFSRLKFPLKGFHGHNNMQMAMANSLEAMKNGAQFLDASFAGMGRGGGNTHIEHLLMTLNRTAGCRFDISLTLEYLGNFFLPEISSKYQWGYSPEQMISGYRNVHPFWLDNLKKNTFLGLDQLDMFLGTLSIEEKKSFKEINISKIEHAISSAVIDKDITCPIDRSLHPPTGDCLVLGKRAFNSSTYSCSFSEFSIFIPNEVDYPSIVHYYSCKVYRVFLRASRAYAWLQGNAPLRNEYIVMPDTPLIPRIGKKLYSLPFIITESAEICRNECMWKIPHCSTGYVCCLLAAWMGYTRIHLRGYELDCPTNEFELVLSRRDARIYQQLLEIGVTISRYAERGNK